MANALDYAEQVLGVHRVQKEADDLLTELDALLGALDAAIDSRRKLDEAIEDRQMDLLIEERGKAAELSQAAMDRRLKEIYHKDEALRQLRMQRNIKAGEASGLDLDVEHTKYRLKVKIARMEELGGYFQFLAAVKNAEPRPALYAEAGSSPQGAVAGGETNATKPVGETT